jgi:hypothetical protein
LLVEQGIIRACINAMKNDPLKPRWDIKAIVIGICVILLLALVVWVLSTREYELTRDRKK